MAVIKRRQEPTAAITGCVVGIDPSVTATGVVVLGSSGRLIHQTCWKSKLKDWPRVYQLRGWLDELLEAHAPEMVLFEDYAVSKFGGSVIHAVTLGTLLRDHCNGAGQAWNAVPPTVVKKFATGKGNAPKDQVTMHVHKAWGFEVPDNNVVDAYVLAQMAREFVWPGRPGFSKERASLCSALKADPHG